MRRQAQARASGVNLGLGVAFHHHRHLAHLRAALLASSTLIAAPAAAQDGTWVAAGPVADWNTNANWAPATVPSGTATFNGAGSAGIVFANAVTTVQTLNFTPGLQVYTFDICACQEFRITGAGVINPSAPAPVFAVDGGLLSFRNSSTSGNATVANVGGRVDFRQSSLAGTADITNRAGGVTTFGNDSSAADATITNRAFSATDFMRSSNAGHADITNNGGITQFFNDANAAFATITNRNGGGTLFFDMSKAGTASITNRDLSGTSFENRSSADHADITNNSGITLFFNQATAGSATITNRNGGATVFNNRTTAEDATIITRTGSFVQFFDRSTGGNARFITDAGGIVDFSATKGLANDGRITAGSIEGGGTYFIGAGNILSVGGNNLSTEVSGVIADFNPCGCGPPGPGALVKVGTGTMTLSGLNTYSGGTTFAGGTVSVSQEANLGNVAGALTFDGGILQVTGTTFHNTTRAINWANGGGGFDIANAANTFTVGQTLGGPGGLTKLGPGTLALTGPNTYSGGTTLAGGTLSISANNNIGTGPLALLNGTTLQLNGFFNFTHPTSIAGDPTVNVPTVGVVTMSAPITDGATPGELVKTGTGTLIFTAANTYTGGTFIDRGTLQLGNSGASGSILGDVRNDANFAIVRSDVFTFAGLISGAGRFEQAGSGTTIFTANNTYTGNTVISGGTLQLGAGGTTGAIASSLVTNLGILAFNRSNIYDFDAVISGTGAVQQNGTGTTIFGATHSYTGATSVNAGTLIVNGSIATSSGVTVNTGGTLGGTGTLPKTTINGGTLSPGNSIGTISINGSLSFVGPGNYIVEVSPTAADKTNVTGAPGSAALAGTLSAIATGGLYTVGKKYTVLNATGGVSGTFANLAVSGSFGITKPHIEYDANNVYLVLDPNELSPFVAGATPNQRAVAGAVDKAIAAGSQSAPFVALFNLTAAQLPAALDQLSGEVHASTAGVLVDESLYARAAVLGRLRQASYGGDSGMASLSMGGPQAFSNGEELGALAYGKSPIVTKAPPFVSQPGSDVVFWAQGFGARGKFDTDGNAAAVRRDLAGFFTGADTRVGSDGRLGIAAGYTASRNNLDGRGSANVETGHLMGYGGWRFGALNLRAGGAYAWHNIDTDRTIAFPGFFDRATARYDGATGQIFGEAGYGFAFGKVAVEPFAGAALVHLKTDAFNERGGAAALAVAANAFEVGYSTLGIRAAGMIPLAADMMLVPRASVAWQHAFTDVTPTAVLAFQNAATPFVTAGVPIARDSVLAEAGLDLAIGRSATLGVSYVGQLARHVQDHAAKGKFSWKF
ncbi:MAG: subtilase-type serine protease [Hyphomicrobiales bacterium]|nr:subtilase-type serine protease [Hyphomicrobiales bacterium]